MVASQLNRYDMKTLRHVMIDLETMSTAPDAAIVSIGAVVFDPRYGKINRNRTFYMELDWDTQNRRTDSSTIEWWDKQTEEAREGLNGMDELDDALKQLADFLPQDARVWGNGSVFDIGILENAYRQSKISIPWKFWNVRDCRTILDMYESQRGGFSKTANRQGAHNALDDAIFQAEYVNMMWNKMLG